jgi:hypothetical protein
MEMVNKFSRSDIITILCLYIFGALILICGYGSPHRNLFEEFFNFIKLFSYTGTLILLLMCWNKIRVKNNPFWVVWIMRIGKSCLLVGSTGIIIGAAIHAKHVLINHEQYGYFTNIFFHLAATLISTGMNIGFILKYLGINE